MKTDRGAITAMDHFKKATANRHQHDQYNNPSLSAVNAVALANRISWEESYGLLLMQGKRYGQMLTESKCIKNMLIEAGYIRMPHIRRMESCSVLNDFLLADYPNITHAIVLTVVGNMRQKRYCAVRRTEEAPAGFDVLDIKEQYRSVISLYLDYREINAPKPSTEAPVMTIERPIASHQGFLYYQPNPLKNRIGDCVIRAYSAVFNRPWGEILEMLAKSCEYNDTSLNGQFTYRSLTSEYEFDPHSRLTSDGKGLTGIEFCKRLNLMYRNGERFFAKVGASHVVGIIPTVIDGEKQYAIADSWDSSSEKIGDYWIFRPANHNTGVEPKDEKKRNVLSLNIGDQLIHPVFGTGIIEKTFTEDKYVQIYFHGYGAKVLGEAWVQANCKQEINYFSTKEAPDLILI